MEQVLGRSMEIPLELAVCAAVVVLGGCSVVRWRRKDGQILAAASALPNPLGLAQASKVADVTGVDPRERPVSIFHSTSRSGHPLAILTRPMLLSRLEAESSAITTRLARESRLRCLTGIRNAGRLTEVMEETLIPLVIRELSPNGLISSGLVASFDQHLLASLENTSATNPTTLSEFTGFHTFHAVAGALFGSTFPSSSVFEDYSLLVQNETQLEAPFSGWMPSTRKLYSARERLMTSITAYLEEWWYADGLHTIPGISRVAERLLHGAKDEELDLEEASGALLSFLVDAHLNLWSTTQRLTSRILSDPSTHRSIVEEVRTDFTYSYSRLLESAANEAFRCFFAQTSERDLTQDAVFTIDGVQHTLKGGTKLVLDLSGLHFDTDVYSNHCRFEARRFLNESLPIPLPFGEGKHMCKGAHLAKLQVKSFIYHVFRKLDIQIAHPEGTTVLESPGPFSLVETKPRGVWKGHELRIALRSAA